MKKTLCLSVILLMFVMTACQKEKEVQVIRPVRGKITESFTEPGRTRLARTWTISMPVDGTIGRITLEPGDSVTSGQVLAEFDLTPYREAVLEAEAAVAELSAHLRVSLYDKMEQTALVEAKKAVQAAEQALLAADAQIQAESMHLDRAQKDLKRQEELYRSNTISESVFDDYKLNAETSLLSLRREEFNRAALNAVVEAYKLLPQMVREYMGKKTLQHDVVIHQLAQAQSRLERARHTLRLATVRSPINGIVLERLHQGDAPLGAGTPLLLLGNMDEMEAVVDVLTRNALSLKPGFPVMMDAGRMGQIPGTVRLIEPAGFTKLSSLGIEQQRVNVICTLERRPDEIGAGYSIQARFLLRDKDNALLVPRYSILQDPQGGFYVYVVRGSALKRQTVVPGISDDFNMEITEGLGEKDVIVKTPDTLLSEGMAVTVREMP